MKGTQHREALLTNDLHNIEIVRALQVYEYVYSRSFGHDQGDRVAYHKDNKQANGHESIAAGATEDVRY
jgi:hypothetical protein